MWSLSKVLGCRPSQVLGFSDDPLVAFYLDRAVAMLGQHVEKEIDKATSDDKDRDKNDRKVQGVLTKILGVAMGGPRKFRDPARSKSARV